MSAERRNLLIGVGAGIGAAVVLAAIFLYLAVTLGLVPANADGRPSALERWAANRSLQATLARQTRDLVNPLPVNDQTLLAGIKIYGANCATCHGDASGRPTVVGFGLYQKAPTLGRHGVEDDPDGETYWKVTHGIRFTGMPSFGKTLSDTERWQVATFLKHMDALPTAPERAWHALHVTAVPASLIPPKRGGPER